MSVSINVPEEIKEDFTKFLNKEKIPLAVASGASADILIVQEAERKECSTSVLYPGGWISCDVALEMADKLTLKRSDIGKIINHLNIKIRNCSLGCF
jgi:hypothetical protein